MADPVPKIYVNLGAVEYIAKHLGMLTAALELQIFWIKTLNDRGNTLHSATRLQLLGRALEGVTIDDLTQNVMMTLKTAKELSESLLAPTSLPGVLEVLKELSVALDASAPTAPTDPAAAP